MNNKQLFIPKKCKIGLQHREGTYTGKLGYVIYHDGKVWRKETSWESWRHKNGEKKNVRKKTGSGEYDWEWEKTTIEGVDPIEFENEPTTGFVLNKKVGGGNSGWNNRQTYCRVYDPRGWEFEITIVNLLFILEESNSLKGKGLSGEFVYSWDGKDLVLLPVHSNDYKICTEYTELQDKKIGRKDLVEGCTYLTSKQVKLLYLGRFPVFIDTYGNCCEGEYYHKGEPKQEKRHVFLNLDNKEKNYDTVYYEFLNSFAKLKEKVSNDIHPEFSNYVEELQKSVYFSKASYLVVEPFTDKEINEFMDDSYINGAYEINGNFNKLYSRYSKETKMFSIGNDRYGWNNQYGGRNFWNGNSFIPPKDHSIEDFRLKYGKLHRVYENGLIKEI